jgi:hypothetical protein
MAQDRGPQIFKKTRSHLKTPVVKEGDDPKIFRHHQTTFSHHSGTLILGASTLIQKSGRSNSGGFVDTWLLQWYIRSPVIIQTLHAHSAHLRQVEPKKKQNNQCGYVEMLSHEVLITYHSKWNIFLFTKALQPPVNQGLLIIEDSWSHSDTLHSVGLLWTSYQPVPETSTWQHKTLTTDRYPRPRMDSNPQSKPASSSRTTP